MIQLANVWLRCSEAREAESEWERGEGVRRRGYKFLLDVCLELGGEKSERLPRKLRVHDFRHIRDLCIRKRHTKREKQTPREYITEK
eukprot:1394627-Amorphochlora_amoeboformis.AAC.3